MNVELTREAHQDLTNILARIEADNPPAARKMAKEFVRKFMMLGCQPCLGTRTKSGNLRVLPVRRSYRLHYEVIDPTLWIRRIIHTSRRWPGIELPD
ncbi:type II toxin-antitoxin system RelE/ParE family toxin [Roseateles chitinivorans]|uniref:type II toxin-antitoxin system RelE/ParE family toxin n=1 Tax=Roseateles chitinivorans TaxID=2917965 RepID=UPI003D664335